MPRPPPRGSLAPLSALCRTPKLSRMVAAVRHRKRWTRGAHASSLGAAILSGEATTKHGDGGWSVGRGFENVTAPRPRSSLSVRTLKGLADPNCLASSPQRFSELAMFGPLLPFGVLLEHLSYCGISCLRPGSSHFSPAPLPCSDREKGK
ncbi:transmembrane protein 187 isoform X2 [Macrotis lagotis]|uniref:transmembrane protein 187 isoform X2 n=1 Tax=Macrotis lagotis TaxID=92651 RepID=UPI003D690187